MGLDRIGMRWNMIGWISLDGSGWDKTGQIGTGEDRTEWDRTE